MMDRLRFWFETECLCYLRCIWLSIRYGYDEDNLAEMFNTRVNIKPEDRLKLKEALDSRDMKKFDELMEKLDIRYDFDEKGYNMFLYKVKLYKAIIFILSIILVYGLLVLIYEGGK